MGTGTAVVTATQTATDVAQIWIRPKGPGTVEEPRSGTRDGLIMTTDEGGMTAMTDGEEGAATLAKTGAGRDGMMEAGTAAADTAETQRMTGRSRGAIVEETVG